MKREKKKQKELTREEVFHFIIGNADYPGSEKEYKDASKIFNCCVNSKGNEHCYQCSKFPCGKYNDLKKSMDKNGYKLIKYQKSLKKSNKSK